MPGFGKRAEQNQPPSMTAAIDRIVWTLTTPLASAEVVTQQAEVLERLRQVTGDRQLELQHLDADQSTFKLYGSRDGFNRVHALWKSKQLPMLLAIPVSDIRKMTKYGRIASAQAQQHSHQLAALQAKAAAPPPERPQPAAPSMAQPTTPAGKPKAAVAAEQPAIADGMADERIIYGHLQSCLFSEPPERILERFQQLFIDATTYEDLAVQAALERLIGARHTNEKFHAFLNHCCYLVIDYWQFDSALRPYLFDLFALFQHVPEPGMKQSRRVRFVRQSARDFSDTEQYRMLQRLAKVLNPQQAAQRPPETHRMSDLIHRYPFLFRRCLLNDASLYEDQQTVKQIQSRVQHHLEFALTRFVTYQVRLAQAAKARQLSSGAGRLLRREPNPTLLGNRELAAALKHFFGRLPNQPCNHRELAQRFLYSVDRIRSYAEFKTALYDYLMTPISELPYCKQQFGDRLAAQIDAILPHYNQHKLDESLILRTATKLANLLIVDPQTSNHYLFVELVANLGATMTVGLLLRLVLICRPVLPEIERRLGLLYEHYESSLQTDVSWLIKALENQNLALIVHFGNADLSPLKQLVRS